jgi:outer membrane protease
MMCAFLIPVVNAQEQTYRFTLDAEVGILWGTSHEIVYNDSRSSRYLSELQWQIQPLWYAGLSTTFGLADPFKRLGFFADLGLKAGLPVETGRMEDRDWFPIVEPSGSLTHFSSHDNKTTLAFMADLGGGFSSPLTSVFLFNVSLRISYMLFRFQAWNGYVQYGQYAQLDPLSKRENGNWGKNTSDTAVPWRADWYKEAVPGKLMTYDQHWIFVSPRAGLILKPGRFTIEAALSVSPLSFCYAFDDHILRGITFTEIMLPGFFIEPEGSVFFAFNENFSAGLEVSYRHTGELKGNSRTTEHGVKGPWIENVAGAVYRAFRGAALVRWTP